MCVLFQVAVCVRVCVWFYSESVQSLIVIVMRIEKVTRRCAHFNLPNVPGKYGQLVT